MANVYGNNGNRWWVGLNVGETGGQQTVFGAPSTIFIGKPSGYESLPSGNAGDDAQFAAAAKKNKGSAKPNTISVENIQWYNIQGPYTTQAAANAAIPAIQKANPAPGIAAQATKNTGVGAVGAAITSVQDFLSMLTSGNFVIRLVKIIAGGVILAIGLAHLTGADKKLGGFAAKAVKVAPLL